MLITGAATSDITAYTRTVAGESPERVAAQVREAADAVVAAYNPVAAEGAALFYESQRPQPGSARVAEPSIGEGLSSELGWALLPLFRPEGFPDPLASLLSGLAGVVQKFVAAGDRDTMLLSQLNDPLAGGIRRFARANACAFCRYLVAIDADVDEDTIWHRNCHCVSVPWWEDNPLPDDPNVDEWGEAAERARAELLRLQRELKPPNMRRRNFFKAHPELAVTTKNILRLMRADLGISH